MPNAPMRVCPRCRRAVAGKCERCTRAGRRDQDSRRLNYRQRGYSTTWDKLRAVYIGEHPTCERCEREGRLRLADMVHHKKPVAAGGDVFAWDNLESLCNACHARTHAELERG